MRDVSRSTHPQSEAIASLRQALAYHQPIAQRSERSRRERWQLLSWVWSPLLLLGLALTGGIGMVALQSLLEPPPVPNCRALSLLAASAKRLHCAQQLASTGDSTHLIASINTVKSWDATHSLHREAQALLTEWSAVLLENAEDTLAVAGLEQAVRLARYIPPTSSVYGTAQAKIEDWQGQWTEGEEIYQTAIAALEQQQWKQASQQVVALGDLTSPYWHNRGSMLSLRIVAEQQGRQILKEAEEMAAQSPAQTPDQIAAALTHLQTIPPQTLAQQEAASLLQTWSPQVIDAAVAEQAAGRLERAVALAQTLPPAAVQTDLPDPVRDLIRYSQAQRFAQKADAQPEQWWLLAEAIASAQAIAPQRELGQRIAPQLAQWQTRRDAMTQLQMAQAIAGTGQRWLLQAGLAQAEAVSDAGGADDLLRSRANELTAAWRQSVAQIDGRPYFALAQQTAQPGSEEALSDAIRIAEPLVASGLEWPQVQQALADWRSRIQVMEDQPIIAQAQKLAADDKFQEAIARAQTIAAGRALHPQAQSLVGEWQGSLRAVADRDRLNEATALANRLRLSRAIEVAREILPASGAVYSEAQTAIAQWQQERNELWAERQRAQDEASWAQPARPAEPAPSPEPVAALPDPEVSADPAESPYSGYYGTTE